MEFLSCISSNYSESGKLGGIYTLRIRLAVICFLESWQQKVSKFLPLPSDGTQHLENCETYFHEILCTATEMFTHNGNLTLFLFLAITTNATS